MTREMKNSGIDWIGQIPADWEITKHKYVMYKVKDICEKYNNEDIISLTMGGVIKRDLENPTGKMPASFDGYQRVYAGNLLLCLFDIDVTPRCVGYIKDSGLTSPAYSQYVVNNGNARYYDYLLRMIDDNKCFLHLSKNLRSSLTDENFSAIQTVAPKEEEQTKIADFLDSKVSEIDKMIEETKSSIENYKEYKQSIITEAVTKGLNKNVQMKDSGIDWIGEIPADWEVLKTSLLYRENVRNYEEGDIPLSLSQVDGLIATEDMKENSLKTSSYENWKKVCLGDLVLNRFKGHLGVLFNATISGMVSFHYGVYEPQRELVGKYYEYMFHSDCYRAILAGKSNGMTVGLQNLSNENFYSVKSLYPPVETQKKIVEFLDRKCIEIDNLISEKEALVSNLEEYKKSLIYEYVTGKKSVL